jgi:Ca-activated chloride channel family protein
MIRVIASIFTFCVFIFGAGNICHASATEEELGGTVIAEINGQVINFPVLKTDIRADIQGDLASVRVIQTFANPSDTPLHAKYLFPMNKDSAVYEMIMEVGDEITKAKIQKKEQAERTFQKAKSEGKAASLLTQHRPNMFTQNIANLMPGLPVKVTIKYSQVVPKIDGAYELVVPLIVGPRYQPVGTGEAPDIIDEGKNFGKPETTSTSAFGKWEIEKLPEYPEVAGLDLPKEIESKRVSIEISVNADMAVQSVYSDTHSIIVQDEFLGEDHEKDKNDGHIKTVRLQEGNVIDNRDFVLRYRLSAEETQAGFLSMRDNRGGFFSLMIEPPAAPEDTDINAREMVFVLDTSGSMNGMPMEASKVFMRHALKGLRQNDYFRIIRFSNNASEFTSEPVRATPQNITNGLAYVDSLSASGGTEIPSAISQAFSIKPKKDTLRIVVFLTDGYIGNESSVLKLISENIGGSRIYAFGVGTSVNRYLLSEMGRKGRGFARFIDPSEEANDAAIDLATRLDAPVLTDIELDWGDMKVSEITPEIIPDLFAGDSIRVQGRFEGEGDHVIKVKGSVRGREASLPVKVKLPDVGSKSKGKDSIPLIWARSRIADMMRNINTPAYLRTEEIHDDRLKKNIVDLGLDFSLVTRWTSFVAVSEKVVNKAPDNTKTANVVLPKVSGVPNSAYPQSFAGGSVPEPETVSGIIIIIFAGIMTMWCRRKYTAALT